ncbi:MAG TPA: transglycosylase domain-containing protein [Sphingobacteriaceae bacterium]
MNNIYSIINYLTNRLKNISDHQSLTVPKLLTLLKKGVLYFLLFCLVLFILVYIGLFGPLPSKMALRERQHDQPSEVYSSDGVLLGRYFIYDKQEVSLEKVSENVISALIATEDVRFYNHHGIDARSMFRVFFKTMLLQQSSAGGGSTLTQQLAKSLYPRKNYWLLETPINKIREMIIASRLEAAYSKEEILELYLNSVHMGGNIYGIERGARTYFNKSAKDLKIQEAAVLVGMLKASTKYNPGRNPKLSRERRNVVLAQMAKYKYITPERAADLQELPLGLKAGKGEAGNGTLASYFREMLRKEMLNWCLEHEKDGGENYNLYRDGLKIYTTINSKAQKAAETAVHQKMLALQAQFNRHWEGRNLWDGNKALIDTEIKRTRRYQVMEAAGKSEEEILQSFKTPVPMKLVNPHTNRILRRTMTPVDSIKYYQKFLNTGLLAMEPGTGYIKAWVGGINFKVFKYDHVLSKRQVGSTFKPILYAAALDEGLEPCQEFENKSVTYGDWTPRNADGRYGGQLTMVQALAHSVNTISAQIINEVGVQKTISLAQDLGITAEMPEVKSLALGTAEIPLLEMVTAYATIANQGIRAKPVYITRITRYNGEVLQEHQPEEPYVAMKADHAATIIEMMKAVVNEGSASRLRTRYGLQMDLAGKTGTTQNQSDGWFIGAIPGLVTGVWVGGENPAIRFRTLELGQGANTALPVWGNFVSGYINTSPGYKYQFAAFPELSPELKEKLSCMYAQPLEPEEYFSDLPFIGEIMKKVRIHPKERKKRGKGKFNLRNIFRKKKDD